MGDFSPSFLELLPGIAAATTTVITCYIAYQQWRANSAKLRMELHKQRLEVFTATMEFLSGILGNGGVDAVKVAEFQSKTRDGLWLFGPEIENYLETIRKKAVDLQGTQRMLEGDHLKASSPGRVAESEKNRDLLLWFGNQFGECKRQFNRYLRITWWR